MGYLEIEGGRPLCGEVKIQGSKNAALPILAAAVLNPGVTVRKNCPEIIDVRYMLEILKCFGCRVTWRQEELIIDASEISSSQVPQEYARKMRSSIMLLGSLLGRTGEAGVPYPGGCVIGERPIDIHIEALKAMGAQLLEEEAQLLGSCGRLQGTCVRLPFPSVGATENVIMAAVLAEGTTVIVNAAREPEIRELCRFLNSMGARIRGGGTECIVIKGVERLHDVEFEIVSDRIVTGTYMLLAAATGGKVIFTNAPLRDLDSMRTILGRMGVRCEKSGESFLLWSPARCRSVSCVCTEPYPGFPTDLQSPLMAALATADGESIIEEKIFEARYKIVGELRKMGADIRVKGSKAAVCGVPRLHGADVSARELRGGAALVLAAAAAEGKSRIANYHFIERGYENIIRDMQALGVMVNLKEDLP